MITETLSSKQQSTALYPGSVERVIYDQIKAGTLKPGEKLGSAQEIAKKFGTSFGSVRQSLESLARKGMVVRKHRAGTFVSPDAMTANGQVFRGNKTNAIALLVPDVKIPEYAWVTRGVEDAAHAHEMDVIISSTDNEKDRFDQLIQRRVEAGVSGMILVAPSYDRVSPAVLLSLQESKIPVVTLGNALDIVDWPAVVTDVSFGTYIAVKHLCDIGRKRIAFMSYEAGFGRSYWQILREVGLYKALQEAGATTKPLELTIPLEFYSFEYGSTNNYELRKFIADWLDKNKNIDAIRCENDHIAAAVLRVLEEKNIRVPQDIAVAGNGNMGKLYGIEPGLLTTTDTHGEEAQSKAVELLMALIKGEHVESYLRFFIKPELICGRSTVLN
ncbi:MAG: GntR family transcriptional regulator [Sedimentisphaerales bacterium]